MAINAVQTTGAIIGGAAGGFAGGLVGSGGNFDAGVSGAISGGLFGWAGGLGDPGSLERYAGHALAGCVGGIASGGCERGAVSAIAGQWGTNISDGGFIATVVVGGTTSVIGGGKFANGAQTAAFGLMFNCWNHPGDCNPNNIEDMDAPIQQVSPLANAFFMMAGGAEEEALTVVGYVATDAENIIRYVGITSRTPSVRWAEHIASDPAKAGLDFEEVDGAVFSSTISARVWEQTQINLYGLGKNGGQLLNRINSISPSKWGNFGIK